MAEKQIKEGKELEFKYLVLLNGTVHRNFRTQEAAIKYCKEYPQLPDNNPYSVITMCEVKGVWETASKFFMFDLDIDDSVDAGQHLAEEPRKPRRPNQTRSVTVTGWHEIKTVYGALIRDLKDIRATLSVLRIARERLGNCEELEEMYRLQLPANMTRLSLEELSANVDHWRTIESYCLDLIKQFEI